MGDCCNCRYYSSQCYHFLPNSCRAGKETKDNVAQINFQQTVIAKADASLDSQVAIRKQTSDLLIGMKNSLTLQSKVLKSNSAINKNVEENLLKQSQVFANTKSIYTEQNKLFSEAIKLQKPIKNEFRVQCTITFKDTEFTRRIRETIDYKENPIAVPILPIDESASDSLKQISKEMHELVKNFYFDLSFENKNKTEMLHLINTNTLDFQSIQKLQKQEAVTPTIANLDFEYSLYYTDQLSQGFTFTVMNYPLRLFSRSDSIVSLNDLDSSNIDIETINAGLMNQGERYQYFGNNFYNFQIMMIGIFCGEYFVVGEGQTPLEGKRYRYMNVKVFRR